MWVAAIYGSGGIVVCSGIGVAPLYEGGGGVAPLSDDVDVVLVRRDREASLDKAEGFEVILQEVAMGSRSRVRLTLEVGAILF